MSKLGVINNFPDVSSQSTPGVGSSVGSTGVGSTDFMKKFIKAEVVSFDDFVACNGWKGSRENGKARLEGRDYIVKDGDVVEFKIGT